MSLLERVGRLIRANINDLVDRAENPEKMLKQLILDMENQLMQVKTQVAMAVADQHLLDRKRKDHDEADAEWLRKAEVALAKGRDDLARDAVDKALSARQAAVNYAQQYEDQRVQVEQLKSAFIKLERKLADTRTHADLLISQHRSARSVNRAAVAAVDESVFDRMRGKVQYEAALGAAHAELAALDSGAEIVAIERQERIEQVLAEIRKKR